MKILSKKEYNTLLILSGQKEKKESEEIKKLKAKIRLLEIRLKLAKNKNIQEYNETIGKGKIDG